MIKTSSLYAIRIYVDESDKKNGTAMYERIVIKARELHLQGATVFRGIAGYGVNGVLHTSKILDLSHNLPIVVEIIDSEEKIDTLLNYLKESGFNGLITGETVNLINFKKPHSA